MQLTEVRRGLNAKQFKWIVFDAVGTLIRPEPSVATAYQRIGSRHGSRLSVTEVNERFRRSFRRSETEFFPNRPVSNDIWSSSDEIELARWRWIVAEVLPDVNDVDHCFQELWDHFADPVSWFCFDEVGASLQSLRDAGCRLAIASNFDSRLHSVCEGHPALRLIEQRFVSSELGYRKPAQQFYTSVIGQCGVEPGDILMIGDDPSHDVSGPIAAGMKALLIDRSSTDSSPDTIRSLSQLIPANPA
ncbi:HAD family hydrolase [Schlesneria sp.]|uniref:HAD family hydrolase n=1 Tax=Schlesneria sp. TaxID=2762018 RepID=UPI002F0479E2